MKFLGFLSMLIAVILITLFFSPVLYYEAPMIWAAVVFIMVGLAGIGFLAVIDPPIRR